MVVWGKLGNRSIFNFLLYCTHFFSGVLCLWHAEEDATSFKLSLPNKNSETSDLSSFFKRIQCVGKKVRTHFTTTPSEKRIYEFSELWIVFTRRVFPEVKSIKLWRLSRTLFFYLYAIASENAQRRKQYIMNISPRRSKNVKLFRLSHEKFGREKQ